MDLANYNEREYELWKNAESIFVYMSEGTEIIVK